MSGIYGDMLLFFPEQFITISVFEMEPNINGGYTVTDDSTQTVKGILQNTTSNRLANSNGNLVKTGGLEFWTMAGDLDGLFSVINGLSYRLIGSNNWNREGGFYKYELEKVVGNDGTNTNDTTWNIGAGSFG